MHAYEELKRKLMKELDDYAEKPAYSTTDIQTIKNILSSINKICEYKDAEEEKRYSGDYSTRRRRDSMGRYSGDDYSYDDDYSREYSRNYSRDHAFMKELHELAKRAPEREKSELMRMIDKLEK